MERISRTGYLSMREAAEWLGMGKSSAAARRLKRKLLLAESRIGKRFLVDDGAGYRITKAQLREALPEHFSRREATVRSLTRRLAKVFAHLKRYQSEKNVLAKQIRELTARMERVEATMGDHERHSSHDLSRREDR